MCFSEKYSRGHGCFKVLIDGVDGTFVIESGMTTLTLKMKEIRVFGAEKGMKTLAGNELGKNLFKEDVWEDILSGQDSVIMEDG